MRVSGTLRLRVMRVGKRRQREEDRMTRGVWDRNSLRNERVVKAERQGESDARIGTMVIAFVDRWYMTTTHTFIYHATRAHQQPRARARQPLSCL